VSSYYNEKLAGERLQHCYRLAPPRVRRYLESELAHASGRVAHGDLVLDLGCGYGRAMPGLSRRVGRCGWVVGVDVSASSLAIGSQLLEGFSNCVLLEMNAARLRFPDEFFDVVLCLQNGVSAFRLDPERLLADALRVTKARGRVLLSSYAEAFWPHRLEWFRTQSQAGLLGEIDEERTGHGVIVCKDGFRATTFGPQQFRSLAARFGKEARIEEVDGSSLFCEIGR